MITLEELMNMADEIREKSGMPELERDLRELAEIKPKQSGAMKVLIQSTASDLQKPIMDALISLKLADESIQVLGIKMLYHYLESFRVQLQKIIENIGTNEETTNKGV